MQCNINRRGRRLRFVAGVMTMGAGAVIFAIGPVTAARTSITIVLMLAGGFQLYEAVKGWCALRAMGIRTPW